MSIQTSLAAMRSALVKPGNLFQLSCKECSWTTEETRAHVADRIERHFAYPDAFSSEHISVVCIDTAAATPPGAGAG